MSNELLQKAIDLAKSQDREAAIPLLVHIIKAEPENVEAWNCLLDMLADDQRRAVLSALVQKNMGGPAAREVLDQISTEDLKPYLADGSGDGVQDVDADVSPDLAVISQSGGQGEWLPEAEIALAAVAASTPNDSDALPQPASQDQENPPILEQPAGESQEDGSVHQEGQPEQAAVDDGPESAEGENEADQDALEGLLALSAAGQATEPGEPVASPSPVISEPTNLLSDPGPALSTPITRRARRRNQGGCLILALVVLLIFIAAGAGMAMLSLRGLVNFDFLPFMPAAVPLVTATSLPTATDEPPVIPSATATATTLPSQTPTPTQPPAPTLTPTPFSGQVIQSPLDGASMVYIPAGTFSMGWNYGDPGETTEHKVSLDAYWMDLTEVTNQMYAACVAAGVCTPPAETRSYKRNAYYGRDEFSAFPVIYVSWQQSQDYCAWAGRRLPSEAEWEYAARGDDRRLYPWGKTRPTTEMANYAFNNKDTTQVGVYPAGASPFGLLDMAGNVAEWVSDWYIENYYTRSSADNPSGPPEGSVRAYRGGSFANQPDKIRTTRRAYDAPGYVSSSLGFRCAQDTP